MTTNIRLSLTDSTAQLLLTAINDRITNLANEWRNTKSMALKSSIHAEMRRLEQTAYTLNAEMARPDLQPAARRMEYSITLCRPDHHEVTTSYPYSQEPAAMDHMASYAAQGFAFRVAFQ